MSSQLQPSSESMPQNFETLAAFRREWIETVLRPWCQQATQIELRKSEQEWLDIAGRVDVKATLWTWAWERFPALVHPDLAGPNETNRVLVTLTDGATASGFPDNRQSVRGQLVLVDTANDGTTRSFGPFSIDTIASVAAIC
jgi:hypothetical protein